MDMGKHDKQGWVKYVTAQGHERRKSVNKTSYWSRTNARSLNQSFEGRVDAVHRTSEGLAANYKLSLPEHLDAQHEIIGNNADLLSGVGGRNSEGSRGDFQRNISLTEFHQPIKRNSQKCLEQDRVMWIWNGRRIKLANPRKSRRSTIIIGTVGENDTSGIRKKSNQSQGPGLGSDSMKHR